MIKVSINSESINFPTTWEEVTYGQYLKILESKSRAELICILLNKDYQTIKDAKVTGLEALFTASEFANKPAKFEVYYDQVGPYKLPKNNHLNEHFDIRFESLGQFEDTRQAMTDVKSNDVIGLMKAYGKAVSIYLSKIKHGVYDTLHVPDMEKEILDYPACEIMSLGQFFFLKLLRLTNGTQDSSPSTPQTRTKSRQALKSSKKRSGRTRR